MTVGLELSFITGFCVGVEWHPMDSVEDDIGYVVIDIGIIRLLVPYGYPDGR
jgi:hypothetical protein